MVRQTADTRAKLVQASGKVTFEQGFAQTSLADIAKESGIPLGNIYYYFKSKESIGEAVLEQRLARLRTAHKAWEETDSPRERLYAYVDSVLDNRAALSRGGCSVGTLCSELNKANSPLGQKASALLREHLDWAQKQFVLLGKRKEARSLAIHLLSALQGVAVLAHSFHDPRLVITETTRLREWIRAL